MRKVTAQTVKAFLAGRPCTVGNSHTDGTGYWLFGNKIAHRTEDGVIHVYDADYQTDTTFDRINAILKLGGSGWYIGRRNWVWYLFNSDHESFEWKGAFNFRPAA